MAQAGEVSTDPLFVGLTRPPMFMGVSYIFAGLNALSCVLAFVNTSDLRILFFLMPGIHLIGYIICFYEPRFIELFLIKVQKTPKVSNESYMGASSYDSY